MKIGSPLAAPLLVAACLALTACGGGGAESGSDGDGDGDGTSGGEVAAQYAGPVQSTDAAGGEELFQAACAPCHDEGPNLANIGWEAGRVRQQVREGTDQMRPVPESRVGAEDLETILAYLQSIGAVTE